MKEKECPCGIVRTDCDYHKPAVVPYTYTYITVMVDGVPMRVKLNWHADGTATFTVPK